MLLLLAASLIAILTTIGIVASLLFEILALLQRRADRRLPVRHALEPASDRPGRSGQDARRGAAVLGHLLHRRGDRDARRDPVRADERDVSDAICHAARAALDEADPRDARGRADRRLRLFRRADGGAGSARFRGVASASPGRVVGKRARRGAGDGGDDHPVRLLDGRRLARRGPRRDARRQPGDGRDLVRDDPPGAAPRRAAGRRRRASCSRSAARSARR